VLAARHEALEERVAIKVLLPEAAAHAGATERFLREGKAAVRIKSEHVAKVMDVGTLESGLPYMVMEFLDGYDLSAVVKARGPQPWPEVVEWVLQASEAIAEAHSIGIVHRDLKPANLFLTRKVDDSPCIKVLDFGISKIRSEGQDKGMTKTSDVMGSPYYMSPEQMRSTRDADARSDVWALGTILFELLGGVPPFDAETMTGLVVAIMQEAPRDLRAMRSDLPPGLIDVVMRCLEKDPARRFQDVASLAMALASFAGPRSRSHIERIVAYAQRGALAPGSHAAGSAASPVSGGAPLQAHVSGSGPMAGSGPMGDSGRMAGSGPQPQLQQGAWHGAPQAMAAAAAQSGPSAPMQQGPSGSQSWGNTQTGPHASRTPAIIGGAVAMLVLSAVGGGLWLTRSRLPSPKMSLTIDLPSPGAGASERAQPEAAPSALPAAQAPEVQPSASNSALAAEPPASATVSSALVAQGEPPAPPVARPLPGAMPLRAPSASTATAAKPTASATSSSQTKSSATAPAVAPKPAPDPFATPD
jgi:eukaryotic-like serine/threonine-protein kinase